MKMDSLSPNQKFQNWGVIFFVTCCMTILLSAGSVYVTWNWGSDWEPVQKHYPIWLEVVKGYFLNDHRVWLLYKKYLIENGWMPEFIIHMLLPSISSLALSSWLSLKLLFVPGGRTLDRHILGSKKIEGRHAYKHANSQLSKECKSGAERGIHLHPRIQISQQSEVGNVLITGQPGSGKTVVMCHILQQVIENHQRAFIYDEKQEYTAKFFEKNKAILIAPWDKRSVVWNISEDMSHSTAPAKFAEYIIPETKDRIWSESARLIFTGIIVFLKSRNKPWGWLQLYKALNLNDRKLRIVLETHYPKAVRFVEENNRTTQSIMITLQSELGWLEWLAKAWPHSYRGTFSIKNWVHNNDEEPTLIVQAHKRFSIVGSPLCHTLLSLMVDEYLTRATFEKCYLVLDELANLPKSPSLIRWLELSRDRGGRTIAGTQAISQLKEIYGNDTTDSLTSMFSNLITLKIGSTGETAKFMSRSLGERVIERPHYHNNQGQTSVKWEQLTLPTVYLSELTQLPNPNKNGVSGFLAINGWSATYSLVWPYPKIPQVAKREQLAKWAKDIPSVKKAIGINSVIPKRILSRRQEESC
jgi:Cdc6-like AAA superfamily ATPase